MNHNENLTTPRKTENGFHMTPQGADSNVARPIITVTLNPAVDVSMNVDHVTPGTLHRVAGFTQDPGGKGINVSKALHGFGIPTLATGFLGGSRGEWIQAELRNQGLQTRFVPVEAETRMNIKVTDDLGRLTEFNTEAGPVSDQHLTVLKGVLHDAMQTNSWVAFCGKLPPGCRADWYQMAIADSKQRGAKTVLDTSGDALKQGIEAGPDVIKPNLAELEYLVQEKLTTVEEVIRAARRIIAKGVSTVVVSMGEHGLAAVREHDAHVITVPSVSVLSTVGAGDTSVAGLLYGLYKGIRYEECIRFAAAAGTAAVTKMGTTHPRLQDIVDILPLVKADRMEVQ